MAKNVIGLLVYQYGPNGASNILTPAVQQGVNTTRINIVSTWKGDFSNPLDTAASGVDPSLRYKVYSYVTQVTPSNAGETRVYTNKTVAQILADINS
jgi:hypothetical protein